MTDARNATNVKSQRVRREDILVQLGKFINETRYSRRGTRRNDQRVFPHAAPPGKPLLVGMGMVTPVAFGLAKALPNRRIIALDRDGEPPPFTQYPAGCRHLSSQDNLCVIVFDNEQLYGSRGGPASQTAHGADLAGIAKAGIGIHSRRLSTASMALPASFLASYRRVDPP